MWRAAGGPSADELLNSVARMILFMEGRNIRYESDRKCLRVELAAMFPRDNEYLVDRAIERALELAEGNDPLSGEGRMGTQMIPIPQMFTC
ncbi:MAG TPA: hypothetical protein VF006_31965 [Longimicrobium sp.]